MIKIWIHLVWATKNREPLLTNNIRQQVFAHIKENAREKGIHLDFINGHIDHVHCLISLNDDQNISKLVQVLKGESSFWINKNQEEHHRVKTFKEEYDGFIKHYEFEVQPG